jgi:uncharacterized RDD family membrane protein YckC
VTEMGTAYRVLAIATPEGVRFEIPLAGPTTRFLAWFVDAVAINGAFLACLKLLNVFKVINPDLITALSIILYFVLMIGCPIGLEWLWRGQTVGKRMFGLRVMDAGGKRLEFTQILLRNLLRVVDTLPLFYMLGGASLVLTRRCQRLGDMVANTVVVRQRKLVLPPVHEPQNSERFNSLLSHPHLTARLRQSVPAPLARIALQAMLRRDELAPEARIAVFRALAAKFRALVPFPDETVAGLADERYVRNCIEIVLNTGNLRRNVYHHNQRT